VETFTINTETVYVTLASQIDYEVATSYIIILEVIDTLKVPPLTGQVTLKVIEFFSELFIIKRPGSSACGS